MQDQLNNYEIQAAGRDGAVPDGAVGVPVLWGPRCCGVPALWGPRRRGAGRGGQKMAAGAGLRAEQRRRRQPRSPRLPHAPSRPVLSRPVPCRPVPSRPRSAPSSER